MSFDLKGIFNIDGRPAKKSVDQIKEDVKKSSEQMSGYLESAFSGDFGKKLFGAAFKAAGLAAIGDLVTDMASKFQEKLKGIKIGSLRSGVDVETFQRLQNVTEDQGSSAETAAKAMEHIAIAQDKIKKGEPEARKLLEGFNALGVSLQDIEQRSFQEIFFKIASGMKDAELSGEKLAAIHELLGRSGAELIPAFKKGFDSTVGSAGLISEGDIKNFDSMKKSLEESNAIWKDMAGIVGGLAVAIASAFKGIPVLFKDIASGEFFRKFSSEHRRQQEEERQEDERLKALRADQAETLRKKDTESSQRQLVERQKQIEQDKEEEKDRKRAEQETPRLEQQLEEKERRNRLEKLSPSARRAELKKEIDAARNALEESQAEEASQREAGDPRFYEDTLKKAIRLQDLQHELTGLEKPKANADDQIKDALSRVGGGFANDNSRSIELLEQIKESTTKTADRVQELKGEENPLGGV